MKLIEREKRALRWIGSNAMSAWATTIVVVAAIGFTIAEVIGVPGVAWQLAIATGIFVVAGICLGAIWEKPHASEGCRGGCSGEYEASP